MVVSQIGIVILLGLSPSSGTACRVLDRKDPHHRYTLVYTIPGSARARGCIIYSPSAAPARRRPWGDVVLPQGSSQTAHRRVQRGPKNA